jgi:hypothetical protein
LLHNASSYTNDLQSLQGFVPQQAIDAVANGTQHE